MDAPRADEGLEHLQRAARELVAAARAFLDVVEDVVEDDQRFRDAAGSLVDVLGDGARVVAEGASAWVPRGDPSWVAAATRRADPDPTQAEPVSDDVTGDDPESAPSTAPRRSTRRVRRVTVD